MTPHDFLDVLMALSCRFPFRITSYYRDPISNALPKISGHPNSRHMLWLAADVEPSNQADRQPLMVEARRQGLGVLDEGDHIHLQVT